jgi:hypothetical protein
MKTLKGVLLFLLLVAALGGSGYAVRQQDNEIEARCQAKILAQVVKTNKAKGVRPPATPTSLTATANRTINSGYSEIYVRWDPLLAEYRWLQTLSRS